MKWFLITLCLTVIACMAFITVTASLDRNVLQAGRELWPDAWFVATLMDAYFGFLTFFVWVAYKEQSWTIRGIWFVAIMLLGSIARQLRILWQVRMLHMAGVLPGNPENAPPEVAAKLPSQHNAIDAVKGREWLLRNYSAQARKFSDADLARALDRVYTADKALKGQGGSQDHHAVMELLVAGLCGE